MTNTCRVPMVPLRGMVAFPNTILNFEVARGKSLASVKRAVEGDSLLFLATQREIRLEDPTQADIYSIGVLCRVQHVLKLQDGVLRVLAEGIARGRLDSLAVGEEYLAEVVCCEQTPIAPEAEEAYRQLLLQAYEEYAEAEGQTPMETLYAWREIDAADKLVDMVAMTFPQKIEAQQELLSEMDVKVRYKKLIDALDAQREILLLEKDIAKETRKRMEKMQREAYLR